MRTLLVIMMLFFCAQVVRGERYLSRSEAEKLLFPKAGKLEKKVFRFNQEEKRKIERESGTRLMVEGVKVTSAWAEEKFLGLIIFDHVLGKHEIIDYAVAISPEGKVLQVEILEYRESYGGEIRGKKWRDQFVGKGSEAKLKLNEDIYNISGATLSCRHVTEGIKRDLAIFNLVCRADIAASGGCRTVPQPDGKWERVQRSQPLLGTFVTITAYGTNRAVLEEAVSAAFAEFNRVDSLLSIHRKDTEIARLNAHAGKGQVQTTPEVWNLLNTAWQISHQTDGAFDVTIGPVAQLWGFIWKEYRLPTSEELKNVLPLVGYDNLQLLPENRAALLKPGMFLDLGGIGKGYAVDRAIEKLRENGVHHAMVRAGGDLRVIGLPPGQKSWTVQIEDPGKKGERMVMPLEGGALSTSGNYENYFEVKGERYSHIIDPRTGLPVKNIVSCTVIAPTSTAADAYATAFFVLEPELAFAKFASQFPTRFVVMDQKNQLRVVSTSEFPRSSGKLPAR